MAKSDVKEVTYQAGHPLGARLSFAMQHACKTGGQLRQELEDNYGINLTRSTLSKILRGRVEHTRYVMEIAEVLGVNPRWLNSGVQTMTDMTGRLSNKDRAVADVKRLSRTHLFPPNRADLIRFHDRFLTASRLGQVSRDDLTLLDSVLGRIVADRSSGGDDD